MNKRQKEIIHSSLNDEKAVLESLKNNYTSALADIKRNIKELQANPLTQSKAYQLEFQKQLERQLTGIIDNLSGKNFSSIADYMNTCYNQGFLGSMYNLHGQGVPLIIPINQNQVLKAVQKTGDDIKLSNKLGVHTKELKSQVLSELQRGLATQLSYGDIARNISNWGQADMNRSMLIARTEGHRVQNEAKIDAFNSAKSKGADIVKQWDSTLDGATRPEHQKLDGQIRELDEDFTVGNYFAPCPGSFGDPYMDCNCRCCMLERARWALDEDELKTLQERAEFFGLDKSDSFDDFKAKYLNAVDNSEESGIINTGAISGALNPYSKAAEKHANTYYESVRHMTTDTTRISKATGISQDKIDKIKNHIFIDEHDLIDGRKRFDPSYDMSQSWQRLISGNFQEKDIVLLKHEYAELRYMEKGLSQNEAHIKASKKYNYAKYCE